MTNRLDFTNETRFGYDATVSGKRRVAPSGVLKSEDNELLESSRRSLTSASRDIVRNFAIAAWAVRKHLDFVSSFNFRSKTGDKALDRRIEELMAWWARPANFDIAGRHPLARFIRIAEARRTLDGDVFLMKLASGHVQAIEGDRIRNGFMPNANAGDTSKLIHGVKVNQAGRALAYALHNRNFNSFVFDRMISASRVIQHGYFERFDQVRGISPIASAINTLRDTYEGIDYALAKAKVSQLFALALYRDGSQGMSGVDFTAGPQLLDMSPEDKAEFLESRTPSGEFQAFMQVTIGIALKALDIPYSFYDEAHTNFFGSRAAQILYVKSAKSKRDDNRELLRRLTVWRYGLWIIDGTLELPRGMSMDDLKFEWISDGLPWWDQAKEIGGDVAAIEATLKTRSEIRKERFGDDWHDVVDELAEEEKYLAAKGVTVQKANVSVNVGNQPKDDDDDKADDK